MKPALFKDNFPEMKVRWGAPSYYIFLFNEDIVMILAVCLNPALQRTLTFGGLEFNRVNRAKSVVLSTGGKGVNVARVAATAGADVRLLTLSGGPNGLELKTLLKREEIPFHPVPVRGNTRICTTLLDRGNGTQTELVEESGPVTKEEAGRAQRAFEKMLPRCRLLILSGTAPKGFPPTVYRRWIESAGKLGIPSILDAPGELAVNGLAGRPWLFKPNWGEMEALLGRRTRPGAEAKSALARLHRMGARNVLVTADGPAAAAYAEGVFYRLASPDLDVVNSIGSGDSIAAGIGAALLLGKTLLEAFRFGMACGSANVLTPLAGTVRMRDVRKLLPNVSIEPF
jgi:tagatose 6-phosphate kinase